MVYLVDIILFCIYFFYMRDAEDTTLWTVIFSRKAEKQKAKLPPVIIDSLYLLRKDLENRGPIVTGWPNYSKIVGSIAGHYHCHLNKGRRNLCGRLASC